MQRVLFSVEVEASTLEDAIKEALRQLEAKQEEVTIEVLREEEKGLFGMPGSKLAKIKASIKARKK